MSGLSLSRRGLSVGMPVVVLLAATSPQLHAQIAFQGGGIATMSEHRVDAGSGVEQSSGTLLGAEGTLFIGSRFELFAHAAGGKLTADSAAAEDRDVGEVELRASLLTVPWLALDAGISSRSYTTTLVRQRWTALRFGGEARLAFVGGGITGLVRAEILPSVSVSGLEKPSRAFAAGAGLEWRVGVLVLGLRYEMERYDFPTVAGVQRREQLSTLTAQAGVRLGRLIAP